MQLWRRTLGELDTGKSSLGAIFPLSFLLHQESWGFYSEVMILFDYKYMGDLVPPRHFTFP
jgi:hypothetical protein